MNKEELKAHFKQREEDMAISMERVKQIKTPNSAIIQLLCAITYDIALMSQYQLGKDNNE